MPVRMEEDEPRNSNDSRKSRGGSSSNSGAGLFAILGFLFIAFRKWPKTTIVVLLIVGAYYFFSSMGTSDSESNVSSDLSEGVGCEMKQEVFDQAEVFEPLDYERNTLPSAVSLEKYAPERLSQGRQGSCVGWASAYAARTILESAATGQNPNDLKFSPSFLYNQIGLEGCQGSYVVDAMKSMTNTGAIPFNEFPYNEQSCSKQPTQEQLRDAERFSMRGYNRLTLDGGDYTIDLLAIKQNIAQGAPVVIGMSVGGTFNKMNGKSTWIPTQNDYSKKNSFGGHAMCVIGYDDNREGGAFQIMNSWGDDFGQDGLFWMPYNHFERFTKEAYGVYPLASKRPEDKTTLAVAFGLVDNSSKAYISLSKKSKNVFVTPRLVVGTKFKIEVKNESECYTYVFGQEVDGSSYVLFPYTKKHSAFCGIVGARLFPKDYSMKLDTMGTKDFMAIVVSKVPLDFNAINSKASNSRKATYADRLQEALSGVLIPDVKFKDGETVSINEVDIENTAALMVIEIDKE